MPADIAHVSFPAIHTLAVLHLHSIAGVYLVPAVLGVIATLLLIQRWTFRTGVEIGTAAHAFGSGLVRVGVPTAGLFLGFGGLTFLARTDSQIGHLAHDVFLVAASVLAVAAALFIARQFQAPPWWKMNAWTQTPSLAGDEGSLKAIVLWIWRDSLAFFADLNIVTRVATMVAVPGLAITIARLIGMHLLLEIVFTALAVTYVALGVALATANRIPRVLMERLNDLRVVAAKIARGERDARADVAATGTYEELTDLVRDFNAMAESLEHEHDQNLRANQRLRAFLQHEQDRATRDALTGMRNRAYFDESLAAEIDRCRRNGSPVTMAMLDLDNFKQVNDRFGHDEGDNVLRRFAAALDQTLRPYDLACRLGGEEFGVIFPETTPEEAAGVLQRVAAAARPGGAKGNPQSFSGGIASFPIHSQVQSELCQLADAAAYTAKLNGKDRCVIYDANSVVIMDSAEHQAQKEHESMLATAKALVSRVDGKDPLGANHSERVAFIAKRLALGLQMDEKTVKDIYLCGLLHDVGKIGIADDVISKPGRLTEAEFEQMRQHPELSYQIINNAGLPNVATWARHHHEHWDGSGYPDHLEGAEIPLPSRIVLVADAFEVMTSDHPYRRAMALIQALAELNSDAGHRFDPQVVELLDRLVRAGQIVALQQPVGQAAA